MFGLSPVKNNVLNEGSAYGDFYNAIDNFFNDDFFNRPSLLAKGFRMDIKETPQSYIIEAELPGVRKEDIEITYNKDNLYIGTKTKEEQKTNTSSDEAKEAKAEKAQTENAEAENSKQEVENSGKVRYLHRERRQISMQRGIYLPDINKEAIEAKLDSGILTVTVPKQNGAQSEMKIQIQ